MRPINKGTAPAIYSHYEDAKQDLLNKLGSYCSYCERRIPTLLAVEHIQPKSLPQYSHLEREWTNFLLACVNCNSSKNDKPIECDTLLLPDRDNTFTAFVYTEAGEVDIVQTLPLDIKTKAQKTINVTALNRFEHENWDETILFSAIERVGQRVQAWVQAKEARADFEAGETSARAIAREAASTGFFSIWMAVFSGIIEVRKALIKAFPNTAIDCFDQNCASISPRPPNGLQHGGKI